MIAAERGHAAFGPAIDQRVLHLIRDNGNTVIGDDTQTLGVEIGQREVTDFALALEVGEMSERVEIAPVTVIPPMELKEIEAFDAHSRERGADRVLDDASRH